MKRGSGRPRATGHEERENPLSLWDQVRSNVVEWYGVAAEKTEEMARVGVRKYDKLTISRTIERCFMELGAQVYGSLRAGQPDLAQDPKVAALIARIGDLEEQLARKEREIADIRASYRPPVLQPEGGRAPAAGEAGSVAAGEARGEDRAPTPSALPPVEPVPDHEDPSAAGPFDDDAEFLEETSARGASRRPPVVDAWEDELSVWDEPIGEADAGGEQAEDEASPPNGRDNKQEGNHHKRD